MSNNYESTNRKKEKILYSIHILLSSTPNSFLFCQINYCTYYFFLLFIKYVHKIDQV